MSPSPNLKAPTELSLLPRAAGDAAAARVVPLEVPVIPRRHRNSTPGAHARGLLGIPPRARRSLGRPPLRIPDGLRHLRQLFALPTALPTVAGPTTPLHHPRRPQHPRCAPLRRASVSPPARRPELGSPRGAGRRGPRPARSAAGAARPARARERPAAGGAESPWPRHRRGALAAGLAGRRGPTTGFPSQGLSLDCFTGLLPPASGSFEGGPGGVGAGFVRGGPSSGPAPAMPRCALGLLGSPRIGASYGPRPLPTCYGAGSALAIVPSPFTLALSRSVSPFSPFRLVPDSGTQRSLFSQSLSTLYVLYIVALLIEK